MEKFRYVQNKKQTKSLPLDAAQFDAISTDLHLAYICDEARKAKHEGNAEEYDKQNGDPDFVDFCQLKFCILIIN